MNLVTDRLSPKSLSGGIPSIMVKLNVYPLDWKSRPTTAGDSLLRECA
jgi:hypothetical protein